MLGLRERPAEHAVRCPFSHGKAKSPGLPTETWAPNGRTHDAETGLRDPLAVAARDPLGADAVLSRLPRMNRNADVAALSDALRTLSPAPERVRTMTVADCAAATRDLGMILGSLRRHDVEPLERVPEALPTFLALGERTSMVPRDTVAHYGPWNPSGLRMRSYTGDRNEVVLVDAVRATVPYLESAIDTLIDLRDVPAESPAFVDRCAKASALVSCLTQAIQKTKSGVDLVFFARELRPYFQPIRMGKRTVLGPAAAHVPLCLVDHLLWSSAEEDPELRKFHTETAEYGVPRWRRHYAEGLGRPALLARVLGELPRVADEARRTAAATALFGIFRPLLTFRGRHRVLAEKAYDPAIRLFSTGSAGYAPAPWLLHALKLTLTHAERLKPFAAPEAFDAEA
jgi:hypothetical protein